MKKTIVLLLLSLLLLFSCKSRESSSFSLEEKEREILVSIGNKNYRALSSDNASSSAFLALLEKGELVVDMHDYGNFEKVGPLGESIVRCDEHITTKPGDIILYQGDKIVLYYDTNTWSFTSLAHIPNVTREELLAVLGEGDVRVTFSLLE